MSANKLWTLIYNKQEERLSIIGLISSPTKIQVSSKFSKSYITICVYVCMCSPSPLPTHSQTQGSQITKIAINLELIEIIQFCLKICEL